LGIEVNTINFLADKAGDEMYHFAHSSLPFWQLETLVSESPDGFVFVDEARRVTLVNKAFADFTGATAPEFTGIHIDELEARLKTCAGENAPWPKMDELESHSAGRQEEAGEDAGDAFVSAQTRQRLHLSSPVKRVLERTRLKTSKSPDQWAVYAYRDITAEARISQVKSDFVSAAAHELRTPLSTVLGFAELLKAQPLSNEEVAEYATLIHRQACELANIFDELLDLSRIESAGSRSFSFQRHRIADIISSIVASYGRGPQANRLRVRYRCRVDTEVMLDAEKFGQALRNIFHNALKYSPEFSDVDVLVAACDRATGSFVRITVADRGIGISGADLDNVFVPFFRGRNVFVRPGTGLGLSLAQQIVEKHGGTIQITSEINRGTTVEIDLPRAVHDAHVASLNDSPPFLRKENVWTEMSEKLRGK